MKKYTLLILGIIISVAAVLRLFNLDKVPASLYWEEAALGYDAYSIAKTGKDYHGNPYPIVAFTSFGDYKPPVYFYSIVPFIQTVGLNAWSVRLPSALAGIATVVIVFFIARSLYGTKVGLVSSAVFAIQPWSMHLSRVGFETNLATLFVALGVLFLVWARKKPQYLVLAAVVFVLSMYTYHSERIVAPLLAVFLILGWGLFKQMKWVLISGVVAVVMLLPILLNISSPAITERAAQTSIFSDLGPIQESNRLKAESNNSVYSRLVYHRYVLFAGKMLTQYTKNFSPTFLFLDGDENIRHGTKEFGLMYHWELPFILVALYLLVRKRRHRSLLPLIWIAIAALPVAMTTASPHALRFASAAPAFALLTGYGVVSAYRAIRRRYSQVFTVVFTLVVVCSTIFYLHYYFTHYPKVSAEQWQYGYAELFTQIAAHKKDGQKVYVSRQQGRPSIYYLFMNIIDPQHVQEMDATAPKDQQELLQVDDYFFDDKLTPESGSIVATQPDLRPAESNELSIVTLPNGRVVWSIWEKP